MQDIELYGVRTNNLKGIDCRIPQAKITVLTGVSGSGKSSLAFDTLYAEGQRRFLESMSAYVRQFLDELPKPAVDRVEHCLPAIALRQQSSMSHPRTTVATQSEILFYLAQLYTHCGAMRCMRCGGEVGEDGREEIVAALNKYSEKQRLLVTATLPRRAEEEASEALVYLAELGYQRLWLKGKVCELSEIAFETLVELPELRVVVDRLIYQPKGPLPGRFDEALEEAFRLGAGHLDIEILGVESLHFSRHYACRSCRQPYSKLRYEFFDPNSTLGACPTCTGFGRVSGIDWQKAIKGHLSLAQDAVTPFANPTKRMRRMQLLAFCEREGIDIEKRFSDLTAEEQEKIKFGVAPYKGVMGFFESLQNSARSFSDRITLAYYRGYKPCEACEGTGFSSVSRAVFLEGHSMTELCRWQISELCSFFERFPKTLIASAGCQTVYEELMLRLRALDAVGLGYMELMRKTRTLSGGESQRLHLANCLGRGLSDTLYVLDEPSAGLHSRDSQRLLSVIQGVQALGNTVVMVEHDPELIAAAEHVIELGPGGGLRGGSILYEGSLAGLLESDTPTGKMLRQKQRPFMQSDDALDEMSSGPKLEIRGARKHNLKGLDLDIPLQRFVVVAGVSGSGKSTLIREVLYESWLSYQGKSLEDEDGDKPEAAKRKKSKLLPGPAETANIFSNFEHAESIQGLHQFQELILMTQGSGGRSLRASVASIADIYSTIRNLLASSPEAKAAGYTAGHFSFNVASGRCPHCEGLGSRVIEMQFLQDLVVPCEACEGKRFLPEVQRIRYKGKNICEILDMTVEEALDFFKGQTKIETALRCLVDLGLEYLSLGQDSSSLSGGEFQRLKLTTYLLRARSNNAGLLFIFDEPSLGLHMQDVEKLIEALRRLVRTEASVIVIEHNLSILMAADQLIELGPEAGPAGGQLVFQGSPKRLWLEGQTHTAKALRAQYPQSTELSL